MIAPKALSDYVIVEQVELPQEGLIKLPDSVTAKQPKPCRIVSVGPDAGYELDEGTIVWVLWMFPVYIRTAGKSYYAIKAQHLVASVPESTMIPNSMPERL